MERLTASQLLGELSAELAAHGWSGLAWACLRRGAQYQTALRLLSINRITAPQLCREFGLGEVKDYEERFDYGEMPKFDPVPVVRSIDGKSVHRRLRVRQKSLLCRDTQIAVMISLENNREQQWKAAQHAIHDAIRQLESAGNLDQSSQKLRDFSRMVELVAPALLAYQLSVYEDWGPSRIGKFLFPGKPWRAAKTKARDLIKRGERYVDQGYRSFALEALAETRKPAVANKSSGDKKPAPKVESPTPAPKTQRELEIEYLILEPLPPR